MLQPARTDLRVAVLHPDRPHNLGAVMRTCACLGVALDVVEPAAFPLDDRRIREAALDYWADLEWRRHTGLNPFLMAMREDQRRCVLLSVNGAVDLHHAEFRPDDVIILGNERDGAPVAAHAAAGLVVRIPLRPGRRSLNVATAAAIALAEALRQTGAFAGPAEDGG